MWMAAGFCMLEAGLVRSKNTTMQCSKNIGLYSIAGIMYWLIGYNLMYSGVDAGYISERRALGVRPIHPLPLTDLKPMILTFTPLVPIGSSKWFLLLQQDQ